MIELTAFKEQRIALALSDYLRSLGISNHIDVEPDRFAIILNNPNDAERANRELDGFLHNPNDARYWQASWHTGQIVKPITQTNEMGVKDVLHNLWARSGIFTLLISVICIAVFLALEAVGKPIFDVLSYPDIFADLQTNHEYWRLLTPIFLHFGAMHIIFNLMWWWELGGLIERTQSKMQLFGVFLATALLSNFAQYVSFGAGFGGLSGVVYGLLGYIWLYPVVNPRIGFRINPALVMFMVGWLVVGYSGILDDILGKMANSAHLIGLLTGIFLGVVFGLLHRISDKTEAGK